MDSTLMTALLFYLLGTGGKGGNGSVPVIMAELVNGTLHMKGNIQARLEKGTFLIG